MKTLRLIALILSTVLYSGCATNPYYVYFFSPKNINIPLATAPLTSKQHVYNLSFSPEYPVSYCLRISTKPWPDPAHMPQYNLTYVVKLYDDDNCVKETIKNKINYGWWRQTDSGFILYSTNKLAINKQYKAVVTLNGDRCTFLKTFGPAKLEIINMDHVAALYFNE